ncbi:MAG: RnfABCDGE type electron transport complex subunit D [Candidatus Omnitrophica bacterium]|nr:RnfABCDGE type electron transport complex subunit D [Candidatus Omnitrophota bacterium]MCM8826011.1 RnfABCDGE type electron transport complex subunit D [Candidatus Omnitrophota bacterium]
MSLIVSSSPHLKSKLTTPYLMRQVIVGLVPVVIASIVFFNYRAILLISICTLTCVFTEEIIFKIRKKRQSQRDFSAFLTGLLLALILPPLTSWYAAVLGSVFAIAIVKHIFGGLGSNIFNPALMARAFLMAAYPKMLTSFCKPLSYDVISQATPLALRKFNFIITPIYKLFIGNVSGSLGETSALAILIGGIYILVRKIADWRIPLSLLLTVTGISSIFYFVNPNNGSVFFHLFSGGLLLGAFFMATDPVTTPVTKIGRYIFGIGCGILIMVIRYFSGLPEGVMYAILFMNMCTPLINRYTSPLPFGVNRR